jgi:poly-gamma-glutamate synthesis protein (capsule biosynthesis protein)
MLGRGVGEVLAGGAPPGSLVAPELAEMIRSCDIVVLNLECCISEGGRRWPDPRKPFFFRAPPVAVEVLVGLGTYYTPRALTERQSADQGAVHGTHPTLAGINLVLEAIEGGCDARGQGLSADGSYLTDLAISSS